MKIVNEKAEQELGILQEQLAQWREHNKGRLIPAELWDHATALARVLGVGKVSGKLGLFHPKLKSRVQEKEGNPPLPFVEVPLAGAMSPTSPGHSNEARLFFRLKLPTGTLKLEWI